MNKKLFFYPNKAEIQTAGNNSFSPHGIGIKRFIKSYSPRLYICYQIIDELLLLSFVLLLPEIKANTKFLNTLWLGKKKPKNVFIGTRILSSPKGIFITSQVSSSPRICILLLGSACRCLKIHATRQFAFGYTSKRFKHLNYSVWGQLLFMCQIRLKSS